MKLEIGQLLQISLLKSQKCDRHCGVAEYGGEEKFWPRNSSSAFFGRQILFLPSIVRLIVFLPSISQSPHKRMIHHVDPLPEHAPSKLMMKMCQQSALSRQILLLQYIS